MADVHNKILVVDDEVELAHLIKEELESENYEVAVAFDGFSALEYLEKNQVNIILSDIRMPKMNGVELLLKVKNKYPEIPFVFMSGYFDESEETLKKKGGVCLIDKPISWEKLLDVLAENTI